MLKKCFIALLLISAFISASCFADEENYFDLDFKQLADIKVYTASQEYESIAESSAIVSVISAKQIKQWGVHDIYEALSYLPGIEKNETYIGYSVLTFRGVTPGLYNNKALFMINGHAVSENLFGSSHFDYVPLEEIERIEVVRSPSSSLYGSNAISGVVNIITKQKLNLEGDTNKNELAFRAGSNDHYYSSATWHEDNITISGSIQKDNGYRYSGTLDEGFNGNQRNAVDFDYHNDLGNVFIDAYDDDWRINAAYFDQDKAKFALNPMVWQHGKNRMKTWYVDVNKSFNLLDGTFNTWLRYDHFNKELHADHFPSPTSPRTTIQNTVEKYNIELQFKKSLGKDLSYIVGGSYENNKSSPFEAKLDDGGINADFSPFLKSQQYDNYALYGQLKYRFMADLNGILGLRAEHNSDAGSSDLVPRLGLTYRYSDATYLKVQYSEAFRSPIFLEKYAYIPGIILGRIDLKREKIKTLEFAIDTKLNDNNSFTLTAYGLNLSDEITRRERTDGGSEYYNADGRKMYGLEFQWDSIINKDWSFMFNASYVDGKVDDYDESVFIANTMGNLVVSYQINSFWSASASNQYIGPKHYKSRYDGTGDISSYNLSNLILDYKIKQHSVQLAIKNIFDQDYTYPESVRRNVAEIPGGPGTTTYISYSYQF
jgi:iron complex outermembrane receptor protein